MGGLVSSSPLPVVATCRRRSDAGGFDGDEHEREARLLAAVQAGAAWVDLEWGSELARHARRFTPARVILSWHDFSATPADLAGRLASMRSTEGATWYKLVPTARRLSDLVRLRDLLRGATDLIAFGMGATGTASRILAAAWGSRAVYAAGSSEPTAPGQITISDMLELYRLRDLGPGTRVAGLLGRPLGHSLSPRLHNEAYRMLELDWVYVPFESEQVDELRDFLISLEISGASVTIPHKEAVLAQLDDVEALARRIGAVNTIVRRGGSLLGTNTDAEAALAPLRRQIPLRGKRVALLGAGGAARALAFTLPQEGCEVKIFNRTERRARQLAQESGVRWGRWRELEREDYDLLINATPVGMAPDTEAAPVPQTWLRGSLVYDIIYNPAETALLRSARARGLDTLGGLEMFVGQAAAQFRLFTGAAPPLDVLRTTVEAALGTRLQRPAGRDGRV